MHQYLPCGLSSHFERQVSPSLLTRRKRDALDYKSGAQPDSAIMVSSLYTCREDSKHRRSRRSHRTTVNSLEILENQKATTLGAVRCARRDASKAVSCSTHPLACIVDTSRTCLEICRTLVCSRRRATIPKLRRTFFPMLWPNACWFIKQTMWTH